MGVAAFALARGAAAQGSSQALTVSGSAPGSTAFAVDAPGTIRVTVVAPATVELSLRGPGGVNASAKGSGTVSVSREATAADVVKGKVWAVVVTAGSPAAPAVHAEVSVTHPGRAYTNDELAALPEAKAAQSARLAIVNKLRVTPSAVVMPKAPTVQTMNDMARAVTAKAGPVNAQVIGLPPQRTLAVVRGRAAPLGIAGNMSTIPAGTFVAAAPSPSPGSSPPSPAPVKPAISAITVSTSGGNGATSAVPCANALCVVHTGDVLTISGADFSKISQQVHLSFITSNMDILAPATLWTDGAVVAQIPPALHGIPNQPGLIWLGEPNSPNQSSAFVFDYKKTFASMKLSFDSKCYPPGSNLFGGGSGFMPAFTTTGFGFDPTVWMDSQSGLPFAGGSGNDILLMNVTLKNGWVMDSVKVDVNPSGITGANASVTEQHPGTSNAEVSIHWWYNAFSSITYTASIFATGEANTSPYVDGYPSGPLPCVP